MKTTTKSNFSLGNLILGILFIIVSIISFKNPSANLTSLAIIFGIVTIIDGIYKLYLKVKIKELLGYKSIALIITAILSIIIGILLLTNLYTTILALPFIFSIWFTIRSINGLIFSDLSRPIGTLFFILTIVINILGIIVGIILIKNPMIAAFSLSYLIGSYFMIIGIFNIIQAFYNNGNILI